jgi:hypothetical protein
MEAKRNAYRIFVGKPEGKRSLRRPRRKWVNIKMDPRGTVWGGMNWINLPQDRDQWRTLVNTVMYLRVPLNTGKFLNLAAQLAASQEGISPISE